jgi:putrescine:ornithine antiporter
MQEQKKMNLIQLTFLVAVNMMGSGIIMLPTNMAKVGAISLLSWIVTALGSMAIAYGFAQMGLFNQRPEVCQRMPKTPVASPAIS